MATKTQDVNSALDETTPLLVASGAGPTSQANEEPLLHENGNGNGESEVREEDDDTPLPRLQIALLCYARIVDPIAYFSIFPFINEMVKVVGGIEEANVGFYTGLIVSFPLSFYVEI